MSKKVLIGVGVLAFAGVAFYLWNKNKKVSEKETNSDLKNNATGEESLPDNELVKIDEKDYRVQKEIEPINYSQVNKGFYYGFNDGRTTRIKNIITNIS